jgi:seryl-tRNA synthetase
MLDFQLVRQRPQLVKDAILRKGTGEPSIVDDVLQLDQTWREKQTALQELQTSVNQMSKEIGQLMKEGLEDEAQQRIQETTEGKQAIKDLEASVRDLLERRDLLALDLPNIPHESVPVGGTAADNKIVFEWGAKPDYDFSPLPHWELIAHHSMADFDRGAKVAGAGFPFYLGAGARLERALINFFLDFAIGEGGYVEMLPPILINAESATATGQLPDKEDLMYECSRDGLFPVPTAEVPVTNFFRDEILMEQQLPAKFCAYTPCFRREAGSYGKEVRGLNRLHQFDKVELVQFVHPERSYDALEELRTDAERVVQALGLPYRRLLMCTGDMGFTQSKKYDLEVWSGAQQRWLEVSSISNFEAFQARRANIRYRSDDTGKPVHVHTLNGSGLALPRIVAALLENNQLADRSIMVPPVLRPFMGADTIC